MPSELNQDVLHVVCGFLSLEQDFNGLYNCARSSRTFAVPALSNLYRIHNKAPIIGVANDDTLVALDRTKAYDRWATLWRSIILSCLPGRITYDAYARSVRKLDFEELQQLLDSSNFRGQVSDKFFKGPMKLLKVHRFVKVRGENLSVLDAGTTANNIAKVVLQETQLLEKLKGTFNSDIIKDFTPQTKRLVRLRVFEGSALKGTGPWFFENCHSFSKIGVYNWMGDEADNECASFLNELRPQTLRSFSIFGGSKISLESFSALNCHCDSLSRLELHSIPADSMQHLSLFKDCTNLQSLVLAENSRATQDLEHRHNDVFLELVEWLGKCGKLKTISISNFISGPALLANLFSEPGVELETLELENYPLTGNNGFHQALALQRNLKSLYLRGEDSETVSDNDTFVESLSKLVNLKDLRLTQISANFTEHHIRTLACNLLSLETFWTGGYHITDAIWEDVKKLKHLQRLELNADTRFTVTGILDFVTSLDETSNQGFTLAIMTQDTDCDIPEQDLEVIREAITSRLGGRFDFQLWRAPEEVLYSDEDSE